MNENSDCCFVVCHRFVAFIPREGHDGKYSVITLFVLQKVKYVASKITIPAVKITGSTQSTTLPFLPDASTLTSPDVCTSAFPVKSIVSETLEMSMLPNPTTVKDEVMPTLLSSDDEENHDDPEFGEFGEFLLDAVDWL